MRLYWLSLPLLTLLVCSCADTGGTFADGGSADATADVRTDSAMPDIDMGTFDAGDIGETVVFAHSADTLFSVDPETLTVSTIGPFVWPGVASKMTDLAVDKNGRMLGVTRDQVYAVDPKTAEVTLLSDLGRHYVGLSFVSSGVAGEADQLIGIVKDGGDVFRIDPQTGTSTLVGSFGSGYNASGDIVSVRGFGTVATVIADGVDTDLLVRVDPATGVATLIGETGFSKIWGLGFWKDKLYGFTGNMEFITIDVQTGAGTLIVTGDSEWWGAGVTTSAPVIK